MKEKVIKQMWMMCSSCGQIAPFYGAAFTRQRLLADIAARGLKANHVRPVRVSVTANMLTSQSGESNG